MNKNFIKIAALIVVMLFSVASFAGNKGQKENAEKRAELRMQKINEVCNLTPQQQAEVKQLFMQKEGKDNKQLQKGNKQALAAARKAENQQFQSSLKQVLTPEQQTKWQGFKQAQKASRPAAIKKK
ncbi:MAG: hypothetical protein GXX78_05235 [Bacteroidales bacterium]|nr:hypothetical protein [Bacteroidales bacterium]